MKERDIESLEADLRALRETEKSRGWAILTAAIQDDVMRACFAMADGLVMTPQEVDYRRGAISAARNMLLVLSALIQRSENELLLASATAEASATNGHAEA